jgi:plastocyanin
MKIPRILVGMALLATGIVAPSVLPDPPAAPAGTVGMKHEEFATETVTIPRGGTVIFYNSSGWLHVIGPGDKGRLKPESGTPYLGKLGAFESETGDTFVSGPWNTPGTYHITCQLHPEMNLIVIVTG